MTTRRSLIDRKSDDLVLIIEGCLPVLFPIDHFVRILTNSSPHSTTYWFYSVQLLKKVVQEKACPFGGFLYSTER